jgi:hypothetical protein
VNELAPVKTLIPDIGPPLGMEQHKKYKREKSLLFESEQCFGYVFEARDFFNLKKNSKKLSYDVADGMTIIKSKSEHIDKLVEILNQFKTGNIS